MRLADQLIAAVGSVNDLGLAGAISSLAAAIARGECFELADDVRDACHEVSQSKPSSMLSAIPLTRLPYEDTWIEWKCAHLPGRDEETDARLMPARMGCLLSAHESLQRGSMTWAWAHSIGGTEAGLEIMICPFGVEFDWRDEADLPKMAADVGRAVSQLPPDIIARMKAAGLHPDGSGLVQIATSWVPKSETEVGDLMRATKKWARLSDDHEERLAAIQLARHNFLLPSLHCAELWIRLGKAQTPQQMQAHADSWYKDIEGEYPFAASFIIMLNARGATVTEKDDLAKLNSRRLKRHKPPLREFVVTRLNMSKVKGNRGAALGISREAARRHLVRGHFKVRRSGIFWWSPYVRGTGDVVLRERYTVTEDARMFPADHLHTRP